MATTTTKNKWAGVGPYANVWTQALRTYPAFVIFVPARYHYFFALALCYRMNQFKLLNFKCIVKCATQKDAAPMAANVASPEAESV